MDGDVNSVPWWWVALAAVGGPVATWVLTAWAQRHRQKQEADTLTRQQAREDKRETLAEAFRMIDVLRSDVDSCEKERAADRARYDADRAADRTMIQTLAVDLARAEARIEYLEEARRLKADPSDTHRPLPPGDG